MILRGKFSPLRGRVRFYNPDIAISWVTPATLVGLITGTPYSLALSATTVIGRTPKYSLVSGTLPSGLTLSGNTLSGTPTMASSGTFTIRASYGRSFVDRTFSAIVGSGAPTWVSYTQNKEFIGTKTGAGLDGTTSRPYYFGGAIGLSTNAEWAIIGTRFYGQTYVHQKVGNTWFHNSIIPGGQGNGTGGRAQIFDNGLIAAIQVLPTASANLGDTYVYWRANTSTSWTNTNRVIINTVPQDFSETFTMSRDGVLFGHYPNSTSIYVAIPPSTGWVGALSRDVRMQNHTTPAPTASTAISRDGTTAAAVGANFCRIFTGGGLYQGVSPVQTFTPSFGPSAADTAACAVAVSDDGMYVAMTNKFGQGVRYTRASGVWGSPIFLTQSIWTPNSTTSGVSGSATGKTISVSKSGIVAIGAFDTIEAGASYNAGRVFMFDSNGNFASVVKANDALAGDYFANKMDMSADGKTLLVGAQIANAANGKAYYFTPDN